jgi:hypothetical protein
MALIKLICPLSLIRAAKDLANNELVSLLEMPTAVQSFYPNFKTIPSNFSE